MKHERQRFPVPGASAELGKKGRLGEPNQHCSRHAPCPTDCPASIQEAEAQTADRPVWNTNHVSVLRIDHISIEGILHGMRQVPYTRRVFNAKKMSRHHVRRPITPAGRLKLGTTYDKHKICGESETRATPMHPCTCSGLIRLQS